MTEQSYPLVSIIIPVYNVEQYLDDCIRSCVSQTWNNLQIIIVDDGSTDSSGAICDRWAETDRRIVAVHQPNRGVSAARNTGLSHVKGEYVCFADGDDICDQKMVETALTAMSTTADMVIFNYYDLSESREISSSYHIDADYHEFRTEKERSFYYLKTFFPYHHGWAVWNRMYKSDLIRKRSLSFSSEFQIAEDMCFNFDYLLHTRRIKVIEEPLYLYRRRMNSAMERSGREYDFDRMNRIGKHLKMSLEQQGREEELRMFPVYFWQLLEAEKGKKSTNYSTEEDRAVLQKQITDWKFFCDQMKALKKRYRILKFHYGRVRTLRILNCAEYFISGNIILYDRRDRIIHNTGRIFFCLNPQNWTYLIKKICQKVKTC